MSVIVIGKFNGDPARLADVFRARAADFEAVAAEARAKGAVHHSFVAGDGHALVIDEWESVEAFQSFFANQEMIPQLMQEAGFLGLPDVTFYGPMAVPGAF
jgi:quinol monooxygenase YgiN